MDDETEIPPLRMPQVGKPSVDQAADEVQRQGGPLVAAEEELGVGDAGLGGELAMVDQVAAKTRQADALAGLRRGGAGLGVLAGEPSHANHGATAAVGQHKAHLQQDLELAGDQVAAAVLEALATVASLEEKAFPATCLGQLALQSFHLPTRHQRRQPGKLAQDRGEKPPVGIDDLLLDRPRFPGVGRPTGALRIGCRHERR